MSEEESPKYTVEDREIMVAVYQRLLWRRLLPHIPSGLAPNTITVLGQIAALGAVITAAAATLGYPFFYLVSAFLFLFYLTADNIDGQHARRTGQASPLGEFLDHGLDGLANGCVLITTCIILHMDGVWMALFCALGGMGFVVTFWEQYRTRKLILPALSAAEGVTMVMAVELLLFATGEPGWLRFNIENMNAATGIMLFVLFGYALALSGPTWRVFKHTRSVGELIPSLLVAGSACGYVGAGASAAMPAVMAVMYGADTTCRLIWLRHQGEDRPLVAPYQYALAVPLIPAAAGLWTADAWAAIAMGLSIAFYGVTLLKAGTAFAGDSHEVRSA